MKPDVLAFFHPPQRSDVAPLEDFVIAQQPPTEPASVADRIRYAVLSLIGRQSIDGQEFDANLSALSAAADTSRGDGFLYDPFQFSMPTDLAFAADATRYLFVVDEGTDSLYVFNPAGVEGVTPPAGAGALRPISVSFGGEGAGPTSFRDPQGVAYYQRIVYVADTGNNRISRYRLNTDFE